MCWFAVKKLPTHSRTTLGWRLLKLSHCMRSLHMYTWIGCAAYERSCSSDALPWFYGRMPLLREEGGFPSEVAGRKSCRWLDSTRRHWRGVVRPPPPVSFSRWGLDIVRSPGGTVAEHEDASKRVRPSVRQFVSYDSDRCGSGGAPSCVAWVRSSSPPVIAPRPGRITSAQSTVRGAQLRQAPAKSRGAPGLVFTLLIFIICYPYWLNF